MEAKPKRHSVSIRYSGPEWERICVWAKTLTVQGLKDSVLVKWLSMAGLAMFEKPRRQPTGKKTTTAAKAAKTQKAQKAA